MSQPSPGASFGHSAPSRRHFPGRGQRQLHFAPACHGAQFCEVRVSDVTGALSNPAGLDMPRWFSAIERDPIVRTLLAAPVPMPEIVVRAMVGAVYRQLAFARPGAAARQVVGSFTSHHRDRAGVRRLLETGRRVLPELGGFPFELERIGCPVLLVWGDRDRMVTHRGAQHIVDAVPGTTYELLEGCGHCPQLEEPDRFAELLLAFAAAPGAVVAAQDSA